MGMGGGGRRCPTVAGVRPTERDGGSSGWRSSRAAALAAVLAFGASPVTAIGQARPGPRSSAVPTGPRLPVVPDVALPPLPNLVVVPRGPAVDSLLRTSGVEWERRRGRHIALYTPVGVRSPGTLAPSTLLDSLDAAWAHAVALGGTPPADTAPITVVVTPSWERFPRLLGPSARGLAYVGGGGGSPVIVLVHHDSARAYTRHEVMHVVASAVWGAPATQWMAEGVATWADGRCQGTSVLAAARDLLRIEPGLTVAGLPARFRRGIGGPVGPRHAAYLLAASFVAFVDGTAGRDALRAVWRTGDTGAAPAIPSDDVAATAAWRQFVDRATAGEPGLAPGALAAHGCG